jgi:hypothetical protein
MSGGNCLKKNYGNGPDHTYFSCVPVKIWKENPICLALHVCSNHRRHCANPKGQFDLQTSFLETRQHFLRFVLPSALLTISRRNLKNGRV